MPGKVIAVANMKGGVGKTATVVALAEALAAGDGARVLVIDLDAQANASIVLAGDTYLAAMIRDGRTIDAFLEDYLLKKRQIRFDDCIRHQISNVSHQNHPLSISLLASSSQLRLLELRLIYDLTRAGFDLKTIVTHIWRILKDELARSARQFDYVLIDCPPGISMLTEASIRLADLVVVPTIPDSLSTFGLQAFCNILSEGAQDVPAFARKRRRRLPHVLVTRLRDVREHRRTLERMRNERLADKPSFALFDRAIPERIAIAEALGMTDAFGQAGVFPTFSNRWGPEVAGILDDLARELKETLHGARA